MYVVFVCMSVLVYVCAHVFVHAEMLTSRECFVLLNSQKCGGGCMGELYNL